jgi:hypothetical protein
VLRVSLPMRNDAQSAPDQGAAFYFTLPERASQGT